MGKRHGHTNPVSPTYISWMAMRQRCLNPKHASYKNYGGRGITVCERWKLFIHFLEDMGVRPKGHSIERKDVNGHYEPDNCCWIPDEHQSKNRRTSVGVHTFAITERDGLLVVGMKKISRVSGVPDKIE